MLNAVLARQHWHTNYFTSSNITSLEVTVEWEQSTYFTLVCLCKEAQYKLTIPPAYAQHTTFE
jgi:hypothetical protein